MIGQVSFFLTPRQLPRPTFYAAEDAKDEEHERKPAAGSCAGDGERLWIAEDMDVSVDMDWDHLQCCTDHLDGLNVSD